MNELCNKVISMYSRNGRNISLLEKEIQSTKNVDIKELLYNVSGILQSSDVQKGYNYIKNVQDTGNMYACDEYKKIADFFKEEDNYITNPISVEEGVNTCKCGSKKTLSYNMQTRSADEATTVFCMCCNCGRKWKM